MSEEVKTRTGATHRPYDEAFKRAAVAQWQGGVPARRVAEGLGITTESLRAWRRQFSGADAVPTTAVDSMLARHRADLSGAAGRGAPVARAASECHQPAGHFKKSRRDLRRPKREHLATIEALEESSPVAISTRPSTCRVRASTLGGREVDHFQPDAVRGGSLWLLRAV